MVNYAKVGGYVGAAAGFVAGVACSMPWVPSDPNEDFGPKITRFGLMVETGIGVGCLGYSLGHVLGNELSDALAGTKVNSRDLDFIL